MVQACNVFCLLSQLYLSQVVTRLSSVQPCDAGKLSYVVSVALITFQFNWILFQAVKVPCLVFNAQVITLFSTGFVLEELNALSIAIALAELCNNSHSQSS